MKYQRYKKWLSIILALILICLSSSLTQLNAQAAEHSTTLEAPNPGSQFLNVDYFSLYALNANSGVWSVAADKDGFTKGTVGNYIKLSWESEDITVTKIIIHATCNNGATSEHLSVQKTDSYGDEVTTDIDNENKTISITADPQIKTYFIISNYTKSNSPDSSKDCNFYNYDIDWIKIVYTINSEDSETDQDSKTDSSPSNQATEQVAKDKQLAEEKSKIEAEEKAKVDAEEKAKADAEEKAYEALVKNEESIQIEALASSTQTISLPSEVQNITEKGEAVYDLSRLQTTKGIVKAIENLNSVISPGVVAPSKEQVNVYTSSPIAFNAQIVDAISQLNSDFVYMFKYKGSLYRIKIPAKTKMDLKGASFQGPLFLAANYGTVEIIK